MDYYEYKKYVYWLGELIPENMQKEAMQQLYYVDEQYIPYIIDIYNSATWSNGLKVIKKIGYPKNRKAINSILYLFQDINWKTTQMAVDTVKEIYSKEPAFVIEAIDNTISKHRDDEMWVEGLQWLKEKLNE